MGAGRTVPDRPSTRCRRGPTADEDRRAFEAFAGGHGRLIKRAALRTDATHPIGWWLFHRWLPERGEHAEAGPVRELLHEIKDPELVHDLGEILEPGRVTALLHAVRRGPNVTNAEFLDRLSGEDQIRVPAVPELDTDLRPIRVDIRSSEQVTSLENGTVDLNAALAMTSQRMKKIDYVGPIASGALGFMVRAGDERIKILADLEGKAICAPEGSTGADIMTREGHLQDRLIVLRDTHSCIESLKKKEVDVVVGDTLPLSALTLEDTDLRIAPNVTIGAPSQYGIALPKGHSKDCTRLRDALLKYVAGGKWLEAFRNRLPNTAQRANELQPSADQINARSCRD
ncbi:transporter substrate-binding domain-containing protein [Streptomyces sp. CS057]|uniref:transporter substrate-binding domain-containing protein n=1 Tax=Streptomyces sp. CS057 TaxID=1982764 RepID=UPI003F93CBD1